MFSSDVIIFVDEGIVHEEIKHNELVEGKATRTVIIISADGFYMRLGEEAMWFEKGNSRIGRLLAYQECLGEIRKLRAGEESRAGHLIPPEGDGEEP